VVWRTSFLQDEVVKTFELTKDGMQEVERRITADFEERSGEGRGTM